MVYLQFRYLPRFCYFQWLQGIFLPERYNPTRSSYRKRKSAWSASSKIRRKARVWWNCRANSSRPRTNRKPIQKTTWPFDQIMPRSGQKKGWNLRRNGPKAAHVSSESNFSRWRFKTFRLFTTKNGNNFVESFLVGNFSIRQHLRLISISGKPSSKELDENTLSWKTRNFILDCQTPDYEAHFGLE